MKVAVIMDSFKGSISSVEAGYAVKEGILRAKPEAEVTVSPIADGGEGTVDTLISGLNGHMEAVNVSDPLGRTIEAKYGIIGATAVIEMSAAAGLTLLDKDERNPEVTSTFGVGEIIKDAIKKGIRNYIIGIGGSATSDGGAGMLEAFGFRFLDENRSEVKRGALGLRELRYIDETYVIEELKECSFKIACDVENPLIGENGASFVFGPQKGANEEMVVELDRCLSNFAEITKHYYPSADPYARGAGAAGGLGFAFTTFLNAELESGISIISGELGIDKMIERVDYVVTGEGRIDSQTIMGKVPVGIAGIAKKYRKKVIAFGGCVTDDACILNSNGIDALFSIVRETCSLDDAMKKENAVKNLSFTAEQVFRLL